MARTSAEAQFETHLHEYDSLRSEISTRIGLQNAAAQGAIRTAGISATVLTAVLALASRPIPIPNQSPQEFAFQEGSFLLFSLRASILVLIFYEVLVQLIIAYWIYQLSMIAQIVRYWNWKTRTQIEVMLRSPGKLFQWDRYRKPQPWSVPWLDTFTTPFQILFIYSLPGLGLALHGTILLLFREYEPAAALNMAWLVAFCVLVIGLTVLLGTHIAVQRANAAKFKDLPNTLGASSGNPGAIPQP